MEQAYDARIPPWTGSKNGVEQLEAVMIRRVGTLLGLGIVVLAIAATSFGQAPAGAPKAATPAKPWNAPETPRANAGPPPVVVPRPGLIFKENWQNPSGVEHPVALDSVTNPNLMLTLYGSGKDMLQSGKSGDDITPVHMMTGLCDRNCALTLKDKNNYLDLTGRAKMRLTSKVTGFHHVHPIVKLADGTWLIAENTDGGVPYGDWTANDFYFADTRWLSYDPDRVTGHGTWITKPDLSKVDEVGWGDPMPGSGHGVGGWSDVAGIEVYGKTAARDTQVSRAQQ
jgi:hypothetical protein